MRPYEFESFKDAVAQAQVQLQFRSKLVHTDHWQGTKISDKPEMATHELAHVSFGVPLRGVEDLDHWRMDIEPNLPWADDHFDERVCGVPINPGLQWAKWPYGHSAARFLDAEGKFNHNYMERYWPKHAGLFAVPTTDLEDWLAVSRDVYADGPVRTHSGIKYEYGDLADVLQLLAKDPPTRQAYLPVWFPEDTGGGSKRAPCTIGYHFLMRDGKLDVNYHIRSCDFVRHFRDDIYLTTRLLLWVISECRKLDDRWADIVPGKFFMQIGSLHLFRNDYAILYKGAQA
jgi:hypothetical protein